MGVTGGGSGHCLGKRPQGCAGEGGDRTEACLWLGDSTHGSGARIVGFVFIGTYRFVRVYCYSGHSNPQPQNRITGDFVQVVPSGVWALGTKAS